MRRLGRALRSALADLLIVVSLTSLLAAMWVGGLSLEQSGEILDQIAVALQEAKL